MLPSDEINDLTDIKAATDENGLLKAWISNIDVDDRRPELDIKTALGDHVKDEFDHPFLWSEEYEIVEFLEKADIEPEIVDEVYDLEIRYDTEKNTVELIDATPDVDGTPLSEAGKEYAQLKKKTINNHWVEGTITDVDVGISNVVVEVDVPNHGTIFFNYTKPDSWRDEYTIVQLCEHLDVTDESQLVGETVAIGRRSELSGKLSHTPFNSPAYDTHELGYRDTLNPTDYLLAPLEYAHGEIPESPKKSQHPSTPSSTSSSPTVTDSSSNDGVNPIVGVILMVAVTILLAAILGTFTLDLVEETAATPTAGVTIEEHTQSEELEILMVNDGTADVVKVVEDGETVGTLSEVGQSYTYEPNSDSGRVTVVAENTIVDTETGEEETVQAAVMAYDYDFE